MVGGGRGRFTSFCLGSGTCIVRNPVNSSNPSDPESDKSDSAHLISLF